VVFPLSRRGQARLDGHERGGLQVYGLVVARWSRSSPHGRMSWRYLSDTCQVVGSTATRNMSVLSGGVDDKATGSLEFGRCREDNWKRSET